MVFTMSPVLVRTCRPPICFECDENVTPARTPLVISDVTWRKTDEESLAEQNQHLFISSLCPFCSLGGTALCVSSFAFFGCQATPKAPYMVKQSTESACGAVAVRLCQLWLPFLLTHSECSRAETLLECNQASLMCNKSH